MNAIKILKEGETYWGLGVKGLCGVCESSHTIIKEMLR